MGWFSNAPEPVRVKEPNWFDQKLLSDLRRIWYGAVKTLQCGYRSDTLHVRFENWNYWFPVAKDKGLEAALKSRSWFLNMNRPTREYWSPEKRSVAALQEAQQEVAYRWLHGYLMPLQELEQRWSPEEITAQWNELTAQVLWPSDFPLEMIRDDSLKGVELPEVFVDRKAVERLEK